MGGCGVQAGVDRAEGEGATPTMVPRPVAEVRGASVSEVSGSRPIGPRRPLIEAIEKGLSQARWRQSPAAARTADHIALRGVDPAVSSAVGVCSPRGICTGSKR